MSDEKRSPYSVKSVIYAGDSARETIRHSSSSVRSFLIARQRMND